MILTLVTRRYRRSVARLALLAMWLVVAGPLIGQFSAAERAHHGAAHQGRHHEAMSRGASSVAMTNEAAPHRHEACGYCSLFQRMPVLSALLPSVAPVPSHAITAPVVATRSPHGGPAVFPQAPTRAPPRSRS
ncbi:DUF2946 domain-containing protein [Halomonas smyrnensis]|uniref:DUF2946 domain-containing protein n=1 Tax=Halomonas smyrnensis TaxID=720605 RepID=UPI000301B948|nr:DUF2946 domain-containing protein [Halomonas smyrnensis]